MKIGYNSLYLLTGLKKANMEIYEFLISASGWRQQPHFQLMGIFEAHHSSSDQSKAARGFASTTPTNRSAFQSLHTRVELDPNSDPPDCIGQGATGPSNSNLAIYIDLEKK